MPQGLEMRIFSLEGRQKEITAALEAPDAYEAGGDAVRLNRELSSVEAELLKLTREWESLSEPE